MAHHEHELDGLRVAVLATDMFEQVELTEPWKALEEAGAKLELVSLEEGEIQGFNHYDKADKFKVDKTVEEVSADDYDAYLQPGGVGNPDTLRMDENAVNFVRETVEQGKPAAVICHGPWMLVEAASGSTGRSSSTATSSRAGSPTTCRPSTRR
jgi:protease I